MKIGIVGAGLVGRILAWRLNQLNKGFKITLIDQHDRNFVGTGLIAAAMVAPYSEAVSTEAITQELGAQSYQRWCKWLPELEAQTGHSISFNQKGSVVVSHAQDDPDWQRFHIKAHAVIAQDQMQSLDRKALNDIEPELAQGFSKGLYFPNEGVINNQALYPALNHYFDQADNIKLIENTKIDNLESLNNDYDLVFDCRGNGAKKDLSNFRSVRGEVARVYAPEVHFSRAVRLIHPRFPLYIAPRENHEYIIGATQIESDSDAPVTVRSGLELLSALYSLHQGFGEANILQLLVGLRPSFTNNLPHITVNNDNNVISINGLYRHGYLFAPILIDDLIQKIFGDENNIHFPQFIATNTSGHYDSKKYDSASYYSANNGSK
ncbi:MAG: FAD-dependent oxidoreductase [Cocleimonas sp.]